ncbi:MAG: T9SS type A sorting domain-containing protein, partial [Flavobacteriales bacterium]|nr:T9SS type A sorting domain-containing protein [Flavobacteriales bacterium]
MAIAQPMFYPNPTSGTITFTNSTSMTPVVQITDVSGRIIDTLLVSAQRQVHLTHLPAGYYLIRFGTQTASLMLVGK